MVLRAKTKMLFSGKELTEQQQKNTDLNIKELESGETILKSYPRRLVFELTNACNLNCVMCGRNAAHIHRDISVLFFCYSCLYKEFLFRFRLLNI